MPAMPARMSAPGEPSRAAPDPSAASDEAATRVRVAAADASTAREVAQAGAEVLRDLSGACSLGIWMRSGEQLRVLGYAVAAGVGGEIEKRIVRSYETVALDAELPGPQAIRRRETLHFERDSSELCLPVRMALVGLGADQLYAVPIFDGDEAVGCALLGLKGDEPLGSAVQEELSNALIWLAQHHRVRRVRDGAED
jgi:hypothetical protein